MTAWTSQRSCSLDPAGILPRRDEGPPAHGSPHVAGRVHHPACQSRASRGRLTAAAFLVVAVSVSVFLALRGRSVGQEPSTPAPDETSKPAPATSQAEPTAPTVSSSVPESAVASAESTEPMERQPYRIVVHLACHPSSRIDEARRADLLHDWQILVRRFVGAPWVISIAPPSSPLLELDLDNPDPSAFASVGAFDKVWLVHADHADAGRVLEFSGREYDTATRRLGPLQRRTVETLNDAPRALLQLALDLFSPTALITGQEGGRALLNVRGAMIEPASPIGRVVAKGTVFQALRLVSNKGAIVVRTIPLTYLQVESVEGPVARCTITSAFRDPLTQRVVQANTLAGVGIKPGQIPLRLRFVTRVDKVPAAGYTLTARVPPDGKPRELGMTDRSGRIVLRPGFAEGLVILRLLAGSVEPVVELPIMPGESSQERVVPINPRPQTVALESQVDSLRDEVVDLVALRARLEARMEARLKGEDWAGLEEAIKEFSRLTRRDEFAKRLSQLKDEAAHEQATNKTAILTKTAQAQINDLQAMIDRYLDDEALRAYIQALEESRTEVAAKEKAQTKAMAKKTAAPPASRRAETKDDGPASKSKSSATARPKAAQPSGGSQAVPY
jgi:hypothetical protein